MTKRYYIGKSRGTVQDREKVHRWVDTVLDLASNGQHILTFGRPERGRTRDQNALLWLWLTCISDETGSSKDDVHDHYCLKFLRKRISFNGRDEETVRGTSGLTVEEMGQFLDMVQADAASELGIILPNPEDLNFQAFEDYYKDRI